MAGAGERTNVHPSVRGLQVHKMQPLHHGGRLRENEHSAVERYNYLRPNRASVI